MLGTSTSALSQCPAPPHPLIDAIRIQVVYVVLIWRLRWHQGRQRGRGMRSRARTYLLPKGMQLPTALRKACSRYACLRYPCMHICRRTITGWDGMSICQADSMKCLQIPQFGAFYPPAQKDSPTPQGKGVKRQMYANGKRTVLPKLPCPLPNERIAASWEAPELEDSEEPIGSTTLAFNAPTLLTLQRTEPPASAAAASPDRPNPAAAESSKDPQLLPVFPQPNHANGRALAQHADTQKQQPLAQGANAFSMPGASDAAAYGSIQPQAAPQQATTGHQLTLGNPTAASSSQQSQISALGAPSHMSRADAGGGGVAAPSSAMPFPPVQPFAVPGQQSGLSFGQPVQQVHLSYGSSDPCIYRIAHKISAINHPVTL